MQGIDVEFTLEAAQQELQRRELEGSLLEFTKFVFKKIKGVEFIVNWHHLTLIKFLEEIYDGKHLHSIINIPPRYTKTELVVKMFSAWCIAKNRKSKFIHLSYSDDLALDNSSEIKEIVLSAEFQTLWPTNLRLDSKSKKKWYTENGGGMYATSTGGQVTGFGAGSIAPVGPFEGAIIIDDPLKPDDALSDTIRTSINDRFNNTIKSRLNSKKTPIVVIMQRLHEDDFAGFLLNGGSEFEWTLLKLPALKEGDPTDEDPREEGEPLWVAKHDAEDLQKMEKADSRTHAGQYQQRPAPADGDIILREWIKTFRAPPSYFEKIIISCDFTFKKTKKSDFVSIQVWGVVGANKYLIHQVIDKMTFTESLAALKMVAVAYPKYKAILIEEKANGAAIIDSVKNILSRVIAINPQESKEARLYACATDFEAGNVYISEVEKWSSGYVEELVSFPNAKNDDQVDATSQFLNYVMLNRVGSFSGMEGKQDKKGFTRSKSKVKSTLY